MKAFIICLCYAAGLGVLSFFLGRLLPKRWLHPDKFPFRTYAWEEKLWKALQIRKWQAKVPDMSRLFKKLMPAKALTQKTAQDLPIMIQETCVAELTHGLLCFAGLALLKIWRGPGGVILTVIYIVFGNLPFLLIQRYNRPRLQRLLESKAAAPIERKPKHANPDFKLQHRSRTQFLRKSHSGGLPEPRRHVRYL